MLRNIIHYLLDHLLNDLISVRISGAVDYPGTYTLQADSVLMTYMNDW